MVNASKSNGSPAGPPVDRRQTPTEAPALPTRNKTFRLPEELLERIDRYKARLERSLPEGVSVKDIDVFVALLRKGLEQVEAEETKRRK